MIKLKKHPNYLPAGSGFPRDYYYYEIDEETVDLMYVLLTRYKDSLLNDNKLDDDSYDDIIIQKLDGIIKQFDYKILQ